MVSVKRKVTVPVGRLDTRSLRRRRWTPYVPSDVRRGEWALLGLTIGCQRVLDGLLWRHRPVLTAVKGGFVLMAARHRLGAGAGDGGRVASCLDIVFASNTDATDRGSSESGDVIEW